MMCWRRVSSGSTTSSSRTGPIDEAANLAEQRIDLLLRLDRFEQRADGAHAAGALVLVFGGDDINRDVARFEILFQATQHPPAADVRQADVERHSRNGIFARQRKRNRSARGGDAFHAGFPGGFQQELNERAVIFDNQNDTISGLNQFAIVVKLVKRDAVLPQRAGPAPGLAARRADRLAAGHAAQRSVRRVRHRQVQA